MKLTDPTEVKKEASEVDNQLHPDLKENLKNPHKVIYFIYDKPKTQIQIQKETGFSKSTLSQFISRNTKEGEHGLLIDGYIEKIAIKGTDHYQATAVGRKIILHEDKMYRDRLANLFSLGERQKTFEAKKNFYADFIQDKINPYDKRFILDFRQLCRVCPEYSDDLLNDPETELALIEESINSLHDGVDIKVGLINIPRTERLPIGHIRSQHLSKLYFVEGIIKQVSKTNAKISTSIFECPSCANRIEVTQIDHTFREPSKCGCGRKGKFLLLNSNLRDFQVLKLEERGEELAGRTQTLDIDVLIYDDLTDPSLQQIYNPGKQIRVYGVLKSDFIYKRGNKTNEQILFLDAVYTEPLEEQFDFKVSKEEMKELVAISRQKKVIDKLVDSLAPGIFGFEEPKKAILCMLVGGGLLSGKKRKEPHVLLIGDPGIAKTSLSKEILDLIPNSRFISGSGASDVGISATAVRDDFTGQWGLRAGGLPLANNSLAVIDELDKKKDELDSLYEALESQEITINKAGISATLKCKTAVLATANPKFGRFDEYKNCVDQIDLPPPLFNRFDLIFPMRDSTKNDEGLADFLLDEATGKAVIPTIDRTLLRKYLAYARTFNPSLSPSKKKYFKEQYLSIRQGAGIKHITPRLFLSMQRLSAGFAKLRLSKSIEIMDIEMAINLVVNCYKDLLGDGDLDTLQTGLSSELRKRINVVLEFIPGSEGVVSFDDILSKTTLEGDELRDILRLLIDKDEIFEPKKGRYQKR